MGFFDKLKSLIIRLFLHMGCKSSCFNVTTVNNSNITTQIDVLTGNVSITSTPNLPNTSIDKNISNSIPHDIGKIDIKEDRKDLPLHIGESIEKATS